MKSVKHKKILFPLQLAVGDRFCNRYSERKFIENSIEQGQHMLIMSPRRYGKTSLVNFVLNQLSYPFSSIDLFVAYDDETICQRICEGVTDILQQIMSRSGRVLQTISESFQSVQAGFTKSGLSLQLTFANQQKDPVGQLNDLLNGLDVLLKKQSKRVVLFIDEFQDLAKAEHATAVQGALRNIAQKTENIIFIFSGSSRRLLSEIFEDRNKPLYKLCKKLLLARIQQEHFHEYIQQAAEYQWKKRLDNEIVDYILEITEQHSFYVNLLCGEIWKNNLPQNKKQVMSAWENCLSEEQRTVEAELSQLSMNQYTLLKLLALRPNTKNPYLKEFLQAANMSNSSVQRSLEFLINNDWVYQDGETLRIIDPLLKFAIIKLANNTWKH